MIKRLALLLTVAVALAVATPAVLTNGVMVEYKAYWQGLNDNYYFGAGDLALDVKAGFLVDTFTIPHGRILDTLECAQGGYYNFFFTDSEAHSISLLPFKKWNSSTIYITTPDSTPILYPGWLSLKVAIHKVAADTPYTTSITRLYWPYKPVRLTN